MVQPTDPIHQSHLTPPEKKQGDSKIWTAVSIALKSIGNFFQKIFGFFSNTLKGRVTVQKDYDLSREQPDFEQKNQLRDLKAHLNIFINQPRDLDEIKSQVSADFGEMLEELKSEKGLPVGIFRSSPQKGSVPTDELKETDKDGYLICLGSEIKKDIKTLQLFKNEEKQIYDYLEKTKPDNFNLQELQNLFKDHPDKTLLLNIFKSLNEVARNSEKHKMTFIALSICFGPNFFSELDPVAMLRLYEPQNKFIQFLIENPKIFE